MTFSKLVKPGMESRIKIATNVDRYLYNGKRFTKKKFELICNYLHTFYRNNVDIGVDDIKDLVDSFFVQLNCKTFKMTDLVENINKVNKIMLERI